MDQCNSYLSLIYILSGLACKTEALGVIDKSRSCNSRLSEQRTSGRRCVLIELTSVFVCFKLIGIRRDARRSKLISINAYLLQVQASVRKLAESVQTVKTVIGMKIQSEQKLVSFRFVFLKRCEIKLLCEMKLTLQTVKSVM